MMRILVVVAALAVASHVVAACSTGAEVTEAQKAALAQSTRDYEHCVTASVNRYRGSTQAFRAMARAVQQTCRLHRERVREALAGYDKDEREQYLETLDALTLEVVRRSMSRMR